MNTPRTLLAAASVLAATGVLGLAGASTATASPVAGAGQYTAAQVADSCHRVYDADTFSLTLTVSDGAPNATYAISSQGVSGSLRTDAEGNGTATLSDVPSIKRVQSASFAEGSTTRVDYVNSCNSATGK